MTLFATCRFLWGLLGITGAAFAGSIALVGVLFYYFKPAVEDSCSFNVAIICLSLFLGCLVTAVSMSPFVSPTQTFTCNLIETCSHPAQTIWRSVAGLAADILSCLILGVLARRDALNPSCTEGLHDKVRSQSH